jgi:hypothetical protein
MTSMTGNSGLRGSAGSSGGQNMAGSNLASGGMMKEKIPSGYKKSTLNNFTPEQHQLFQQLFSHAGPDSYLSRLAGGDQSTFGEIEAPAMRQFQELQGDIASRFSGKGLGARRGSGFKNYINQETSDFAMQLQAKRQGLQRQAIQDLMGISNDLLSKRPYENSLVQKQEKQSSGAGWGALGGATIGGLVGLAGGPFGAYAGAQIGQGIGSAF